MIVTITGDNQHRVQEAVNNYVTEFMKSHDALAVERLSADELQIEQIIATVSATSLLSPQKLVVMDDFEANKQLIEKTQDLIDSVTEDTTLLIIIRKLDKRLSYGKLLRKTTDFREFNKLSPAETIQWIIDEVKRLKGEISRSTATYLVERVSDDQDRLANEIAKLILYDPEITKETIDELCEQQPSSTVFELLDAGFSGRNKQALELYEEQRRLQVEPIAIIGMVGWQLHILTLVKLAKDKPAAQIAKDAGIHPFVVQKSLKLANKLSLGKLKQLVRQAIGLEVLLKNRTSNADDAVRYFLLNLAIS